ncbi:hypothetical protein U9M48_043404 [Paspalum notatum var. saurae]|uniref:Uncharacterized protein n=1 Tax=Paspalum notatum var. saurae TaxID=547442 RepID=A0AAQ3XIK3_PASNO
MRNPNPPPLRHAAGPESRSTLWSSSPPLPMPHDNIGDCPFFDAVSVLTSSDRSLAPFPSPLRLPPTCAPLYRLFPFTQLLFLPPASLLGCCSVFASPLSLQQEQKPLHKSLTSPPITGSQLISEPSSAATQIEDFGDSLVSIAALDDPNNLLTHSLHLNIM